MEMINFWTFKEYMAENAFPALEPVVEGLLNQTELALITATAKSGKTWFSLHLALSVVTGQSFLGRFPTKKGKVLLIQTEVGPANFRERILKVEGAYGISAEGRTEYPIISCDRIKLDTAEGMKSFSAAVADVNPTLVVLDSWYTFHSKDESSAKDMAPLLTDIRDVAKRNSCSILIVHHQGKKGDAGQSSHAGMAARGSSSFADVPDVLMSLTRKEGGLRSLAFEMRNLETPDPIILRFSGGTCGFEIVESESATASQGRVPVQQALLAKLPDSGIKKVDLVKEVREETGQSERSIEKAISSAMKERLLVRKQVGKEAVFFPSSVDDEPSHARTSLEDCGDAEEGVEERYSDKEWQAYLDRKEFFESPDSPSASLDEDLPY